MSKKERRQYILDTVSDLAAGFLYYDRKEDEDLERGEIEAAIHNGEITVDEIVNVLREEIEISMKEK